MDSDIQQPTNDNQAQPAVPTEQPAPAPPAEQPVPAAVPADPAAQTETPPAEQAADVPATQQPSEVPAENAPATEAAAAMESGHPKKVLLVEDDDNLANVYEMRLQAEGFEVNRVPNGEDALASALQFKPDLILLDVMMPKVSGFDVLDILRNTPETANIRIVMLTALGQEADQQRAKDLGVDDYLIKSQVVLADVVERIKSHLDM